MAEKIALFDLDGTLADYDEQLTRDMVKLAAPDEPSPNHREPLPRHLLNRMKLIKSQRDWWINLPQIPTGFQVLRIAEEIGFKISILTKGPTTTPYAWTEKVIWCQKNISANANINITHDKGLVYGRVLVDDYPDYMSAWLAYRPRGLGLMPKREYNKDFEHKNVVKYDDSNMDEVRERLQAAFDREEGEVTGTVKEPTLENVLLEYRCIKNPVGTYDNMGKAHRPAEWAAKLGAKAAIMGLAPCPWCNAQMKERDDQNYIAVCIYNPSHIVQWTPWPG